MMDGYACVTPWKGRTHLVEGWLEATQPFERRIVVWNGPQKLPPSTFPADVEIVRDPVKEKGRDARQVGDVGFGFWCNLGIERALDWDDLKELWVLNNDIRGLFDPVSAIPRHGVAGPQITSTRSAVYPGNTKTPAGLYLDGCPDIPYLDGWSLGFPARIARHLWSMYGEVIPQLGGYYWEDPMLSLRLGKMGVTLYEMDTGLLHLGGRTTVSTVGINVMFQRNRERIIRALKEELS